MTAPRKLPVEEDPPNKTENERDERSDVPGQPEPSAEAEGENEPELDEARARRLSR